MLKNQNIFYKKKILIYGLGKSGLSALKFLKPYNKITTYDDKIRNDNKKIMNVGWQIKNNNYLKRLNKIFLKP